MLMQALQEAHITKAHITSRPRKKRGDLTLPAIMSQFLMASLKLAPTGSILFLLKEYPFPLAACVCLHAWLLLLIILPHGNKLKVTDTLETWTV